MTASAQRIIGALMAFAAAAFLGWASRRSPIGDWTTWTVLLALGLLALGLVGLYAVISSRSNVITGRNADPRRTRFASAGGLAAAILLSASTVVRGDLSAQQILYLGIGVALTVMFLGSLIAASRPGAR